MCLCVCARLCLCVCIHACNYTIQVGDLTTSSQLLLNTNYSNKRTKFKVTSYDGHDTVQVFTNNIIL